MATHSRILAWEVPWADEPGGLQSMGSERVGHNWVSNTFTIPEQLSFYHNVFCFAFLWVFLPHSLHLPRSQFSFTLSTGVPLAAWGCVYLNYFK